MTDFATELAAASKIPFSLWVMTLDWCGNTFGSSPCTATGAKCYNTYFTCRDTAHFTKTTKDYTFSPCGAPIPFPGPRPYITKERLLPTEIKDSLTVSARMGVDMADEPDTDVGIDPYYDTRPSIQGEFWKKLIARNPNYKGRPIKRYQGFYGLTQAQIIAGGPRFDGVIDNITVGSSGSVTIEAKDLLGKLDDIEIPAKIDVKLAAGIDASQTGISLESEYGDFPASDFYVRIGDEVIYVATRTGNQCASCTRASFGTTAATHSQGDKVQFCRYWAPQSGYDILADMLTTDGEVDAGSVDSTAYAAWKAFDADMPYFSALITEPTKLRVLYFEVVDLLDCKSWVTEEMKVTISKNLPNFPGRTYATFTDAANIKEGSCKVDLNAKSRVSRVSLYWEKDVIGKADEPNSYARLDVFIDSQGEGANLYNEVAEKKVFCRWLRHDYMDEDLVTRFIRCVGARMLRLYKNPMPLLTFRAGLKDSGTKTGDYVKITTSALQEKDGSDVTGAVFQIAKREQKENLIEFKALKYPAKRICFIQDATGAADYTSATEAQKEYGFICDADGESMSNGDAGYYLY
jgi:hypothetical protein